MGTSFEHLDRDALAELAARFAADGIVRIEPFLDHSEALALHDYLRHRSDWLQIINSGDSIVELDRETRAAMDAVQRNQIDDAVYGQARYGFQYRYETIRIPDDRAGRALQSDALTRIATRLSEGTMRDRLRVITGAGDIAFADAQATAYSPGDFLTGHDDAFDGKNRRAAYVLSLTPQWREEWGGLLLLHGSAAAPARAYSPGMNVLTLFRIPTMHSVSEVSRAAAYRRYSVTGWLRAR